MKKRLFCFLAFVCIVMSLAPLYAKADHGPKPSVDVKVENTSKTTAYATLLGPKSSYWNKEAVIVSDGKVVQGSKIGDYPDEIFMKFAQYTDSDGFYYYGDAAEVTDGGSVGWYYGTQERFKLLVYYPETDSYAVSDICERYTFYSFHKVVLDEKADNGHLNVEKDVSGHFTRNIGPRILGFIGRLIFTLAIEILLAYVFGIRHKAAIKVLAVTNVITQVALNIVILLASANGQFYGTVSAYVISEILIVIAEAFVYVKKIRKPDGSRYSGIKLCTYSFLANLLSAILGMLIIVYVEFYAR